MSLIETAKELRRQADLIESIATRPKADPLDIAYLAIGAEEGWKECQGALGDIGHQEVIETVIAFADNLRRAWAALGDDGWSGGNWYYEVSEPLGTWIVEQWAALGQCPSSAEVDEYIIEVVTGVRA